MQLKTIQKFLIYTPDNCDFLEKRAAAYTNVHNYANAIADYKKAICNCPGISKFYKKLGLLEMKTGNPSGAIRNYTDALEKSSGDSQLYSLRAEAFLALNKIPEALSDIHKAIKTSPDSGTLYNIRGEIHYACGEVASAIVDFETAIEKEPDSVAPYLNIKNILEADGEYVRAFKMFMKAMKVDKWGVQDEFISKQKTGSRTYQLILQGCAYRYKKQYLQANKKFTEAAELMPNLFLPDILMYEVFRCLGNNNTALKHLEQANNLCPELQSQPGKIGWEKLISKDYIFIKPPPQKKFKWDSDFFQIYYQQGREYSKAGNYDLAIEYLKKALMLKNDYQILSDIGFLYRELGDHHKAIEYYKKSVSLNSRWPLVYLNLGDSCVQLKQYRDAVRYYSEAIELDPSSMAYGCRAFAYNKLGMTAKAIDEYSKGLRIDPENSKLLCLRGNLYMNTGNSQAAFNDYCRTLKNDPDNIDALINRGILYSKAKQFNEAINDFNNAVKYAPHHSGAYKNRACARFQMGEKVAACSDFKKACELGDCTAYALGKKQGVCK